MSKKRLLVAHAEGIGNQIQISPCLRNLNEVLGYEVDYWSVFGSYSIPRNLFPYVDRFFVGNEINNINLLDYEGVLATVWTKNYIQPLLSFGLPLLNKIVPLTMDRSEVDVYIQIVRDLGILESSIKWHAKCNYRKVDDHIDIVLSNGYNRYGAANWSVKSYPYYKELANILIEKNYSVCSIGAKNEYIKGTIDKTGLNLLDSGGIIKNSKLLISNDSAMYHYANTLGVDNIVIFTATSIDKNYDKRFHKYSTLIYRTDLDCRPCQAGRRWAKDCKDWECREIDFDYICEVIKSVMD